MTLERHGRKHNRSYANNYMQTRSKDKENTGNKDKQDGHGENNQADIQEDIDTPMQKDDVPPPFDGNKEGYEAWLSKLSAWLIVTKQPAGEQAIRIRLALSGQADVIAGRLDLEELIKTDGKNGRDVGLQRETVPEGVHYLIAALNTSGYRGSDTDVLHQRWNSFILMRRGVGASMMEYTSTFRSRMDAVCRGDVKLDDTCMAMHMLTMAELDEDQVSRAKTVALASGGITVANVQRALISLFPTTESTGAGEPRQVMAAIQRPRERDVSNLQCHRCQQKGHGSWSCTAPKPVPRNKFNLPPYPSVGVGEEGKCHAVLDTGCGSSVVGSKVFERLTNGHDVERLPVEDVFSFGVVEQTAMAKVVVPIWIAGMAATLRCHVIEDPPGRELPLLLSRHTMKVLRVVIFLQKNRAKVMGQYVPLIGTSGGHLAIPIRFRKQLAPMVQVLAATKRVPTDIDTENAGTLRAAEPQAPRPDEAQAPESAEESATGQEQQGKRQEPRPDTAAEVEVEKLRRIHVNTGHASFERMKEVLQARGTWDASMSGPLRSLVKQCKDCDLFARPRARPKVSLPPTATFNDRIAYDLMQVEGRWALKIVDMHTRFLRIGLVEDKTAAEVLRVLEERWIDDFGPPRKAVLADPGSENVADVVLQFWEAREVETLFTAGQSHESLGICEDGRCGEENGHDHEE